MKFLFDLTLSVELIALGVGVAFLIWGYRNEGCTACLGKVTGYIITILAALALIFTSLYGMGYFMKGHFVSPVPKAMMMKKSMMIQDKGMMEHKLMKPKPHMRQ